MPQFGQDCLPLRYYPSLLCVPVSSMLILLDSELNITILAVEIQISAGLRVFSLRGVCEPHLTKSAISWYSSPKARAQTRFVSRAVQQKMHHMNPTAVTSCIHLKVTSVPPKHSCSIPNKTSTHSVSRRTAHKHDLQQRPQIMAQSTRSASTCLALTMPRSQANGDEHQAQWHQRRSDESAGILLFLTTVHMACWLLVGSIGWATSPQLLSDDPIVVVLILLWFTQIATGGCLMAVVAPSLAVSSTAATIGATMATIYRTLIASNGNGAVWSFWISAAAYAGIAAEAVFGVLQMLQDSIAHRVQRSASARPI